MDNRTRSERTRNVVLEAALAIIARDGPTRLTLDAIAREAGISKGALMHQFRTKEAVLTALLDRQTAYFENFSQAYSAEFGPAQSQPHLAAQIATLREALSTPRSVVFAILGAAAEEPALLSATRERGAIEMAAIKAEAADPDLAILRSLAAWGLALTTLLGHSPLSPEERQRLFDRLLDERQWSSFPPPPPSEGGRKGRI
jgi:AcrR family transcriptional regulator